MFLKLFRTQYIFQIIIVLLIALVLWFEALIKPLPMPAGNPIIPMYNLIFFLLGNINTLSVIIAFLFVIYEALYVNKILSDNKLIPRNTFLPAFVFILFMSYSTTNLSLNPMILSLAFIIPAFNSILNAYDKSDAFTEIFNSGILIGIASFFYFPASGFFIVIWTGLYVFRIFVWRHWIIGISGLILPYLFLAVYYFVNDQLLAMIKVYADFYTHNIGLNFLFTDKDNTYVYVLAVVNTLVVFISFSNIISHLNEKVITQRKKITLILDLLVITLFTFFYRDNFLYIQKMFFAFPLTLIVALFFSNIKRNFINELIFTVLVVVILAGRVFM